MVKTDLLSEYYRVLVESVIARLPDDWYLVKGQPPKRVTFVQTSEPPPEHPTGLAETQFRADSPYRRTVSNHTVLLYSRNLAACSDDVVLWAIAHELGHVVSSHLTARCANEEEHEGWADSLAMGWGFAREWEAWAAWNRAANP